MLDLILSILNFLQKIFVSLSPEMQQKIIDAVIGAMKGDFGRFYDEAQRNQQ